MGWFSSSDEKPASDITHDITPPSGFESSYSTGSSFDSGSSFGSSSSFGTSAGTSRASSGTADLQQFVQQQELQAKLQEGIFKMNDTCWEKCMGSVDSKLSGKQETCITNCVERFIDASQFIMQRYAQLLQAQTRQ